MISLYDETEGSLKISRVVTLSSPRPRYCLSIDSVRGANLEGCPVLSFKGSCCLRVTKFSRLSQSSQTWRRVCSNCSLRSARSISNYHWAEDEKQTLVLFSLLLTDAAVSLHFIVWGQSQSGTGSDSCKLSPVPWVPPDLGRLELILSHVIIDNRPLLHLSIQSGDLLIIVNFNTNWVEFLLNRLPMTQQWFLGDISTVIRLQSN